MMRSYLRSLLATVFALALIAPLFSASATAQDIQTRVQILHGGPDVGDVEVHINGDEVLDNFSYGNVSDWIDVDPGTARFTITADRTGFNYVIFDTVYPVPAGNDYYVVITDALVIGGAFDTSSVPADGARVQVTHASVDTPAINIVASGDNLDLGTDVQYGRTTESAPLPSGTYDFEATLTDSGESVLTATGIVIEPGKSYQLVVIGTPGDDDAPLELVVLSTDLDGVDAGGATPVS